MTDAEFEKSLSELGRATVPANPMRSDVMARIAALPIPGLDSDRVARFSSRRMFRAAVILSSAACITVIVLFRHSRPEPARPEIVRLPETHPAAPPDAENFPRLADFQRAYAQSPEAFERLLQQPISKAFHAAEIQLSVGNAMHLDSKLYQ